MWKIQIGIKWRGVFFLWFNFLSHFYIIVIKNNMIKIPVIISIALISAPFEINSSEYLDLYFPASLTFNINRRNQYISHASVWVVKIYCRKKTSHKGERKQNLRADWNYLDILFSSAKNNFSSHNFIYFLKYVRILHCIFFWI